MNILKVYLVLTLRQLNKNRIFSAINIFGLSISLAICILLWSYVFFETSYDSAFIKSARIYQLNTTLYSLEMDGSTAHGVGPALKEAVPAIKNFVRIQEFGGALTWRSRSGEIKRYEATPLACVDSSFFSVFATSRRPSPLVNSLSKPSSIVVSRDLASKIFGDPDDAVGQLIDLKGEWLTAELTVTGVVNEWPVNSTLSFQALISIEPLLQTQFYRNDPRWNGFSTFVELDETASRENVIRTMRSFVKQYTAGQQLAYEPEIFLQPIRDVHLGNRDAREGRNMESIYVFIVISFIVLLIAWANCINLSTARAMDRAREVGVRKAIGVVRWQLIGQFMTESFIVNLISLLIAIALSILLLPAASELIGKPFDLMLTESSRLLVLLVLLTVGTITSGAYPAFVLSSFKTTDVIKGNSNPAVTGISMRKVLMVFQSGLSLCLLVCTVAILTQINFMERQDKGITTSQVLVVSDLDEITNNPNVRVQSFKKDLQSLSSVSHVSTSGVVPGGSYNWDSHMEIAGKSKEEGIPGENTYVIFSDMDLASTYSMKLIEGRNWDPLRKSDLKTVLINEATIVPFGLKTAKDALGEKVIFGGDTLTIIGVLKNFYWESLKVTHHPIVIWPVEIYPRRASLLVTGNMKDVVGQVEHVFKKHFPDNEFKYYFTDDFYNRVYQSDQRFGNAVMVFAGFAIIVACMGLLGLASFTVRQRAREISIRKVLGASISNIMALLTGQFGKLVVVATFLAVPVSWIAVDTWLARYPVRMNIEPLLFVGPIALLFIIAMTSVITQVYRGARTDPAKVLRR